MLGTSAITIVGKTIFWNHAKGKELNRISCIVCKHTLGIIKIKSNFVELFWKVFISCLPGFEYTLLMAHKGKIPEMYYKTKKFYTMSNAFKVLVTTIVFEENRRIVEIYYQESRHKNEQISGCQSGMANCIIVVLCHKARLSPIQVIVNIRLFRDKQFCQIW